MSPAPLSPAPKASDPTASDPSAPTLEKPTTRLPRSVVISAWAVPVMIVGQFAMLAVVPVVLVLVGAFRDARLRALRGWAAALGVAYAVPLALWAIGPDRAPSLSKDIHPVLAGVVVAASVAVAVVFHVLAARRARAAREAGA